jgi:hypothetical protein
LPRIRVVFDVNVYRALSGERFAALRRAERNHSVVGVASYWVAAELLAQLATEPSTERSSAFAALRRLRDHCTTYDGSNYVLGFLASISDQIGYTVFGVIPSERGNLSQYYASAVAAVTSASDGDAARVAYSTQLDIIRNTLADEEQRFVRNVWENGIRSLLPAAESWDAIMRDRVARNQAQAQLSGEEAELAAAKIIAVQVAAACGVSLTDRELDRAVLVMRDLVPDAIRLLVAVLRRLICDGIRLDVQRHRNTLWDTHLTCCTTSFSRIDRTPVWLITNDRPILTVAEESGSRDIIMSLQEYEEALRRPTL